MNIAATVPHAVHVCRATYRGSPFGPRYVVLVIPAGETSGEYYECGERSLALLRNGMTPDDLELDPVDEDEAE